MIIAWQKNKQTRWQRMAHRFDNSCCPVTF